MTKREFNKTINACRNKSKTQLDKSKIALLDDETKTNLVYFIMRNRGPIITDLITPMLDIAWLHCCGYLYKTKGKHFTFVHTCEHTIH